MGLELLTRNISTDRVTIAGDGLAPGVRSLGIALHLIGWIILTQR